MKVQTQVLESVNTPYWKTDALLLLGRASPCQALQIRSNAGVTGTRIAHTLVTK